MGSCPIQERESKISKKISRTGGGAPSPLGGVRGETAYWAREIQDGALPRLYNVVFFLVSIATFSSSRTMKGKCRLVWGL